MEVDIITAIPNLLIEYWKVYEQNNVVKSMPFRSLFLRTRPLYFYFNNNAAQHSISFYWTNEGN
jgi:hypothetical protein